MHRGAPQVGIDEQCRITALSTNVGQVHQSGGLALSGTAADHADGICLRITAIEFKICPQYPVGFRIRAGSALAVQNAYILGNDRENRHLKVALDILDILDTDIQVIEEERQSDPEEESCYGPEKQVSADIRLRWIRIGLGSLVNHRRCLRHELVDRAGPQLGLHFSKHFPIQEIHLLRLLQIDNPPLSVNHAILLLEFKSLHFGQLSLRHCKTVIE